MLLPSNGGRCPSSPLPPCPSDTLVQLLLTLIFLLNLGLFLVLTALPIFYSLPVEHATWAAKNLDKHGTGAGAAEAVVASAGDAAVHLKEQRSRISEATSRTVTNDRKIDVVFNSEMESSGSLSMKDVESIVIT